MGLWSMVSKYKRKETILPSHWSEFSEKLVWLFLPWITFQCGRNSEEVVLFVIPSCGCSLQYWILGFPGVYYIISTSGFVNKA